MHTSTLALFRRYSKPAAVFTIITMVCAQCASTGDGRLAQGQGAGLGALGGALIGGAINGKKGALAGAAIGGLAGFAYGSHIANKKSQYKSTEAWLDACIKDAEAKRRQAVAYNSRLNNQLASLQSRVKTAKAAGDKKALASLKTQIRSERIAAEKESVNYSKEADAHRSAISQAGGQGSSRLKTLRTSTSGIDTQVSTMKSNVKRYAALESQTDV